MPSLTDQLSSLETAARQLEPSPELRGKLREKVIGYAEQFLNSIYEVPAFRITPDMGAGLLDSPVAEDPIGIDEAISLMDLQLDKPGLNPASGGHLGYIPGGGIYISSLGDYLADITNRYAGVSFAGPGAVRMEQMLIDWMAKLVGYPATAGGNLTSGGSIANLVGIVAARDAHGFKASDIERSVIYLTSQAHHSVDKAIRIAGLRECIIRTVPTDTMHRMDAAALETLLANDRKSGLNPFLIIAAAGTTDTGAVDPMDVLAGLAKGYHCWLHIDGAYGAFFVLCEEGRRILKGMERCDSLVMDPHKGLFLPYGSGAVLVRNRDDLVRAFWYQANYLQDAVKAGAEPSPADLSPELTKHFRGLRLWLPLKLHGLAPFRAAVEEKLLLARYFHEKIGEIDGFEVGGFPDLSVVTYRYIPRRGDADAFNQALVREVQNDGRVFISSTMLNGKFTLRCAILSFRTHRDTVDLLLEILREKTARLEGSR
jgi:aromatic-L-amino-acid/L-tryptophan decarboxylase